MMSWSILIVQGAFIGYLTGLAFPISEEPFAFFLACLVNAILTVTYGTLKEFGK